MVAAFKGQKIHSRQLEVKKATGQVQIINFPVTVQQTMYARYL